MKQFFILLLFLTNCYVLIAQPPVNNNCDDAIELTVYDGPNLCDPTNGTTAEATDFGVQPSCLDDTESPYHGIWYEIPVTNYQNGITIEVSTTNALANFGVNFSYLIGSSCAEASSEGIFAEEDCMTNNGGTTITLSLSNIPNNPVEFYKIQIWSQMGGFGSTVDFSICVYETPTTWYVNDDATGANNGMTWMDAFNDLQDALNAAASGDQIYVKQGTYLPDGANQEDRTLSFNLKSGVNIYGSFPDAISEPVLADRDLSNPNYELSQLSGNIGDDNLSTDNSYHVLAANFVSNVTLDGFSIQDGYANGNGLANAGGGIDVNTNSFSSNIDFTNCHFKDNYAESNGGAVRVFSNFGASPTLNFTDCQFLDNTANTANGGAIYISCVDSDVSGIYTSLLTRCSFNNNTANNGGAISCFTSNGARNASQFIQCNFESNTASTDGGAIQFVNDSGNGEPSYTGCFFTNNQAGTNGGAIAVETKNNGRYIANTIGSHFLFNSTTTGSGGAISSDNRSGINVNVTFNNSFFVGNNSDIAGGAIYFFNTGANNTAQLDIATTLFANNQTRMGVDPIGGAISNWAEVNAEVTATINRCTFEDNSSRRGGAIDNIRLTDATNDCTITNSIFSNNVADNGINGFGGAIYNAENDASIINCTFYDNRALNTGQAIRNRNASPLIYNCIFRDTNNSGIVIENDNSTPVVEHCNVRDGYAGTGNIDVDPDFIDVGFGNYQLLTSSPCINAGNNSLIPPNLMEDFSGDNRIKDGTVNMGAFEDSVVPIHDNVCEAIDLTFDITNAGEQVRMVAFANVGGSVEIDEPAPSYHASCINPNTWCDGAVPTANLDNTVWFKFVAPTAGNIEIIAGVTGFDTQMALWEANACKDITDGNAVMVAANDDLGPNANFDFSRISVSCLIPNKEYYLQIDGSNGAVGKSDIRISTNPNFPCEVYIYTGTTDLECGTETVSSVTSTGSGEWLHLEDQNGNIIASVNDKKNTLGQVDLDFMINTDAVRTSPENNEPYLDRNWQISVTQQPTSDVCVRFYFTEMEFQDLVTAAGVVEDISNLSISKISDELCNDFQVTANSNLQTFPIIGSAQFGTAYCVQVEIPSFSAFYVNAAPLALPLQLLSFTGKNNHATNTLQWITTAEQGVNRFEIERSTDGKTHWETLDKVKVQGETVEAQYYQFIDDKPLAKSFYRLKIVEQTGKFEYSEVVFLALDIHPITFAVFPNPADQQLQIQVAGDKAGEVEIIDLIGEQVWSSRQLQIESNTFSLNVKDWKSGVYLIRLQLGQERLIKKIVIK